MFAFLGSLIGGLFSVAGGVASAAGAVAGAGVSALGGLVGGIGGLVFGQGLTVGQQMAAIAEPAYYETAGAGILGVASATSQTVDYLGNLMPTALGIYQQIAPPKIEAPATAAKVIPSVPAPTITRTALPIISQQPAIMTIGAAAKPEPSYLLYIGLAILALFLLRKK